MLYKRRGCIQEKVVYVDSSPFKEIRFNEMEFTCMSLKKGDIAKIIGN